MNFKPFFLTPIRLGALLILTAALQSCSVSHTPKKSGYMAGIGSGSVHSTATSKNYPSPAIHDDISYWDGDDTDGVALIKINRTEQKASFYKNNKLVGISKISSGSEDHSTPPGRYKITEKHKDHKSSLYGVFTDAKTGVIINNNVDIRVDKKPPGAIYYPAPMPNFMRFNGGIGMHTGYLPGYAASHGCIRMPHYMSEKFFENVKVGTPVIVE